MRIFRGHKGRINSVVLSEDGQHVVSGSDDCKVIVWEIETGEIKYRLDNHRGGVRTVTFSHDLIYFASGGDDKTIKLWEFKTGKLL